ncbi:serine/arginine repetitive matrix protein 2-like [Amphibalanus amphitrite]|uniref:serine/arginine repetitive matrix protein 2-like n=1 Tax=Amphibalanus amphitrite TaxID=1232801 RepID=UPI001C920B43|nr:serine/arginine repetitive matrix protein 2-like [Amphibalanus amphitrite]
MATASARLSEAGRRKRAELCARQRQRGPAPLASFEDISVDRSVDCSMERSVDLDIEGGGVMAKAAPAEINCQKLALPAVSIQVSKASSSASEGSRATTPEADGGFQEEVGELRGATDELGAPHMSVRKDSVSSAGSELILPISGRSSRISSFCSTASGRRSVSPYRTMLETSFCGSRPLAPPEEPTEIPEPRLPALASNGHHTPSPAVSPPMRRDSTPVRRESPPLRRKSSSLRRESPPLRKESPPLRRASPPEDRRACTLPPHQAPPNESSRKASLGQNQRRREESLSPAMTPDSPLPRRKSSFSRFLSEAKRELRERSRSRSKSKEREMDGKGSILSIFKRKASHPRKADGERSPPRSPSLENRLEDEINKVEFKFFDGESANTNEQVCNNAVSSEESTERKGPDAPVVQGYGNVMRELNSALMQRTQRPAGESPPPALPLKSPSRLTRDFGAVSVEHDHPRPAGVELGPRVLPAVIPKLDKNKDNENKPASTKAEEKYIAQEKEKPKLSTDAEKEVNDIPSAPRAESPPAAVAAEPAGGSAADEADAEVRSVCSVRSVRSSGSDKESSAAERSEPVGPDAEATQLCQADSDEDELPYVPTTLPLERPLQHPIVPIEQRGSDLRCTAGVERPRSAKEVTPADLNNYVKEASTEPAPTSQRVKILIPQDSLKLIRTPKRMAMKSWSQFAHEGLQSPRLKRQQRAAETETTSSGDGPRMSVIQAESSLAEDEEEEEHEEAKGDKSPVVLSDTPPGTPPGWVCVNELPEPRRTPRKLGSVSTSATVHQHSSSSPTHSSTDTKHTNLIRSSSAAPQRRPRNVDEDSRRRSDPAETPPSRSTPRSPAADCTDCPCRLSLTSGSSQELPTSGSFSQLPRSPVEMREGELKHEEIQSRLGADCAPVHRQTALLADTLEDATLTYFRTVQENSPSAAEARRRSASTPRKDSYGNVLTVDRPGSRPRLSSTGSAKSRSPSPHKMLIETSFCGRQPVPAPGSFEVDDLVDISHLPSETASLHTDTDSSGRQSQDGCVCRCHSDTDDQDTDRRQEELRERLSVVSGSSSSSGPPTCTERPPPDRTELSRSGDTEYLLAQPPAPFGMDLDVPSNRSSRVISPPPSWPSSPEDAPAPEV